MPHPDRSPRSSRAAKTTGRLVPAVYRSAGTVPAVAHELINISPRTSLDQLERLVRSRFARDGQVRAVAPLNDERRCRMLRRLYQRLAADDTLADGDSLEVLWGERHDPDGGHRWLVVKYPEAPSASAWGEVLG
jgi:hypothetical protein